MSEIKQNGMRNRYYSLIGATSIILGVFLLLENLFKLDWLMYFLPFVGGVLFIYFGVKYINNFIQITGWIILIVGVASVLIYTRQYNVVQALGILFAGIGVSWLFFFLSKYFLSKEVKFWALLPFFNLLGLGLAFLSKELRFLDFFFFIGMGITLSLLGSGLYWKVFGLIIPGSLLAGIVPGVYFPWEQTDFQNPLIQTGIMLVWFALGWGLITVFSRVQTQAFVWWPLIPGGILAMVGWGLYIGGSPENAAGFIGNTGSIALIIFGIYILLMKRGLHR